MKAYLLKPKRLFSSKVKRENFAEAGAADPANNIRKGQELGEGIQQRLKYVNKKGQKVFRYITSGVKDTALKEHITPKDANIFRQQLIKKYNLGEAAEYKGAKSYKELIKDPDFENFWKARVDKRSVSEVGGTQGKNKFEEGLDKIIKKYKLKPDDYEGIFNKFLEETRISEGIRKGTRTAKGKEKLISPAFIDNFIQTFNKSYKPNVGTINTTQMEKLLNLSEGELAKLMASIDKPLPPEKLRFEKSPVVARINKAAIVKDKLDAAGITYEKFSRTEGKGGKDYRFKLGKNTDEVAKKLIELQNKKDFGFEQKSPTQPQRIKQAIATASKQSDEYKNFGYSRDRGTIDNLTTALNNSLKSMSDKELLNFIDNNPKLKNLVTATFNSRTGEIVNVPLEDLSMEQIRNSAQFEVDHIRGRATVDYDSATKKILDGLDIEYPKNLYIIPKAINSSVKKAVENYVANFPNETKKIKKINKYFTDNQLTYFNRNTNSYAGYKPSKSAVDVAHLGITQAKELEDLITGTYVDDQGITRVKTNDAKKLVATVQDLQKTRGGTYLLSTILPPQLFSFVEDFKKGNYGKGSFKVAGAASIPIAGYFAQDEFKKGYPAIDIISSALTGFKPTESIARTFVSEEKGGYTDAERLARAQLKLLKNPPKASLDMSPVLSLAEKDPEFEGTPNEYLSYLESKREGIESLAAGAEKKFQEKIMQPYLNEKASERRGFIEGIKTLFDPNKFGPANPNTRLELFTGGVASLFKKAAQVSEALRRVKNSTFEMWNNVRMFGEQKGVAKNLESFTNIPDKNRKIASIEDLKALKESVPEKYHQDLNIMMRSIEQNNFETAWKEYKKFELDLDPTLKFENIPQEYFPMLDPLNDAFVIKGPKDNFKTGRYQIKTSMELGDDAKPTGKYQTETYDTFDPETRTFRKEPVLVGASTEKGKKGLN